MRGVHVRVIYKTFGGPDSRKKTTKIKNNDNINKTLQKTNVIAVVRPCRRDPYLYTCVYFLFYARTHGADADYFVSRRFIERNLSFVKKIKNVIHNIIIISSERVVVNSPKRFAYTIRRFEAVAIRAFF